MLNQIYIHYITTLFVLESFILSCWLLKEKKNRYRPRKIMIGASLLQYESNINPLCLQQLRCRLIY